jgi:ubiquinone/menaquinone biosynthesis C-methylase UbiE
MNEAHRELCSSSEWAEFLSEEILGPLLGPVDLGAEVLEIGPGAGAATGWLAERVKRLTCIESDAGAAAALERRFVGGNLRVVVGDASAMDFADDYFDSVCCFTMLHHVPTLRSQNQLLSESFRVLRAGGVLVGSDSLASNGLHQFHEGDTYNPVEPGTLLTRLQTVGFRRLTIFVGDDLRFIAKKPEEGSDDESECDGAGSQPDRDQCEV